MQTQPNFKQLLDQFVADMERKQNEVKAELAAKVKAKAASVSAEAAAARAYFDSRLAAQRAIL